MIYSRDKYTAAMNTVTTSVDKHFGYSILVIV